MFSAKVDQLIQILEKQELEAENGVASPQLYSELFAVYLYKNDLSNCRFLWKRIPQNIKDGNAELKQMHSVFVSLWNNSSVDFFNAINFEWSQSTAELMFELKEKIRNQTIDLVGKAYTSIFENVLIDMANLSEDNVSEICNSLGWEVDPESHPRLIIPKEKRSEHMVNTSAQDQLFVLTEFVSFLEN